MLKLFRKKPSKRAARGPHGNLSKLDGEWLRRARAALLLTQADFGNEIGITKTEVYRKEKNQRPITQVQVLAVECLLRRAEKWPLRQPRF